MSQSQRRRDHIDGKYLEALERDRDEKEKLEKKVAALELLVRQQQRVAALQSPSQLPQTMGQPPAPQTEYPGTTAAMTSNVTSSMKERNPDAYTKTLEQIILRQDQEKANFWAKHGRNIQKETQQEEKNFTNSQLFNAYRKYAPDVRKMLFKWVAYMTMHMGNLFNVKDSQMDEAGPWRMIAAALVVLFIGYAYYINNRVGIAAWQATPYAIPEVIAVLLGVGYFLSQEKYRKRIGL